jgi:hypothetical protein
MEVDTAAISDTLEAGLEGQQAVSLDDQLTAYRCACGWGGRGTG